MSFILDALKKSENERQQQSSAEFSSVPASTPQPGPFRWLWLLGGLLTVNLIILVGLLINVNAPTDPATAADTATADTAPAVGPVPQTEATADPSPSFAEQVAQAQQDQPPPRETATPAEQPPQPRATTTSRTPAVAAPRVPTIDELLMDGSIQLPELHVDIHVYSDVPDERFVFINMVKHRERSRLSEGPIVREITPGGAILEHQGRTFLLPRE
jgi:general secretion pathway protein B